MLFGGIGGMLFSAKRFCHLLLVWGLVWTVDSSLSSQAHSQPHNRVLGRNRGMSASPHGDRQEIAYRILLLLLLCMGLIYLRNIYAHSRFILLGDLSGRIQLLYWDEFGDTVEVKSWRDKSKSEIYAQLTFEDRIRAWLKANPLMLGFPGQYYEETVELRLGLGAGRLRIHLEPKRNSSRYFGSHPADAEGRLFARATKGGRTVFFGHSDQSGKISGLMPSKRLKGKGVTEIPNETKFVDAGSGETWYEFRKVDGPAGWKISRSG
jgi:hypothetical protein